MIGYKKRGGNNMNEKARENRNAYQREYLKQYREKNKEKLNGYQREWRKNNQDKVKRYQENYWTKKGEE